MINAKELYNSLLTDSRITELVDEDNILTSWPDEEIKTFIRNFGYDDINLAKCLNRLAIRLKVDDFPHEIGLVLGYPLDDVKAFIKNPVHLGTKIFHRLFQGFPVRRLPFPRTRKIVQHAHLNRPKPLLIQGTDF